jgi:LmbE family N-acetylglucosaminyl deacetylase
VNVVVLAAHPDDEALGCGGAVLTHMAAGDRVVVVFVTSGEGGLGSYPVEEARRIREAEARAAAEVLGFVSVEFLRLPDGSLVDDLGALRSMLSPLVDGVDIVYAPHPAEDHADHAALGRVVGDMASGAEAFGYEIWTPVARPDRIVDVSAVMARKLEAVRCYRCQLEHWPYDRAVEGLNAYRGALFEGVDYAEAFTRL